MAIQIGGSFCFCGYCRTQDQGKAAEAGCVGKGQLARRKERSVGEMGESVYPMWKGADASCPRHQMSRVLQKDAEQESQMRAEIQDMKQELSTVNMMDEFARYARLERKINKMTDKLKTHGTFTGPVESFVRADAERNLCVNVRRTRVLILGCSQCRYKLSSCLEGTQ